MLQEQQLLMNREFGDSLYIMKCDFYTLFLSFLPESYLLVNTAFLEQDAHLDNLALSVGRQRDISIQINDELGTHTGLLEALDEDLDNTGNRLTNARQRLDKFSRGVKGNCVCFRLEFSAGEILNVDSYREFIYDCRTDSYSLDPHHRFQDLAVTWVLSSYAFALTYCRPYTIASSTIFTQFLGLLRPNHTPKQAGFSAQECGGLT